MQDTAQRLLTGQTAATSDDEADNTHTHAHTRFLCEGSEEVRPQPEGLGNDSSGGSWSDVREQTHSDDTD